MPEWKPVPGYEGRYLVSDEGQVKSVLTNRLLRPGVMSRGYLTVNLYDGSKPKRSRSLLVHRVVLSAFIGPPPEKRQVNHRNMNKHDNRLANLEYVTQSENIRHADTLRKRAPWTDARRAKFEATKATD